MIQRLLEYANATMDEKEAEVIITIVDNICP